ncbi:regulatory protein GemA [Sphingobium sp. TB-6]|uniref:regulatory protein GemA n=1 Tax=Sphingobium sp. TB-6 TaxID=2728850 RepID=UPI00146EFDF7|nr:regulatory protein GemA [Sphingobium sp. TB-6]NML88367.1 regulatory protein GemA [Sphingobium sp. TB-6]
MPANAAVRIDEDKSRKILLAKVHLAKKQLGLDGDTYQGVLMRVAGVTSAGSCTVPQLRLVVSDFERLGFSSKARKSSGAPRADHPVARKARTMWISLALLCAIDINPSAAIKSDKALEMFAKRQLGSEKLQWANQSQADKLIEALKAMADRHGWDHSIKGLAKVHYVHALKVRLCFAILAKLKRAGLAGEDWTLGQAAFRLCGISDGNSALWSTQELEHMSNALGRHLRTYGGRDVFKEVRP